VFLNPYQSCIRPPQLVGHTGPVRDACFNRDNSLIATASSDRTVRLWQPNMRSEAVMCINTRVQNVRGGGGGAASGSASAASLASSSSASEEVCMNKFALFFISRGYL
jgi:WD40 repeat protein